MASDDANTSAPPNADADQPHEEKTLKKKKERRARKKKVVESYKRYILRVLKALIHRNMSISVKAIQIMDNFIGDMFEKIALEASRLAKYDQRSTLTTRDIQAAVKLILPGDLAKNAVSEATKAIARFNSV